MAVKSSCLIPLYVNRPGLQERRKSTAATSSVKQDSHTQMSEVVSQAADTMTVVSIAQTDRTIPVSKTKSTVGDEDMRLPDLTADGDLNFILLTFL